MNQKHVYDAAEKIQDLIKDGRTAEALKELGRLKAEAIKAVKI